MVVRMKWLYLSHKLFSGEDQLVVDDPARSLLVETTVGVDEDTLLVLDRLVGPRLPAQARRVVEEPRRHRLEVTGPHTTLINNKATHNVNKYSLGLQQES